MASVAISEDLLELAQQEIIELAKAFGREIQDTHSGVKIFYKDGEVGVRQVLGNKQLVVAYEFAPDRKPEKGVDLEQVKLRLESLLAPKPFAPPVVVDPGDSILET